MPPTLPFVVSRPQAVSNHPAQNATVRLRHPSIHRASAALGTNGLSVLSGILK
jgi:hypothetical protein